MRYKAKITFNGDSFVAEREEMQEQAITYLDEVILDLQRRVSYLELPWYIKFKLWIQSFKK